MAPEIDKRFPAFDLEEKDNSVGTNGEEPVVTYERRKRGRMGSSGMSPEHISYTRRCQHRLMEAVNKD